ncbi:hypothetical protein [Streptomyces sp. NPDC005322]|uniref:hypothetical protein n=1 Tax=Streptomyces sp. NPDC005322 TaxID=3157032 RepID=UPI0033BC8031
MPPLAASSGASKPPHREDGPPPRDAPPATAGRCPPHPLTRGRGLIRRDFADTPQGLLPLRRALATGRGVAELVLEKGLLPAERLAEVPRPEEIAGRR